LVALWLPNVLTFFERLARREEVEVLFDGEEDQARVTLQHRGFEVHGEAGPGMRESVGSDGGWRSLLQRPRAAA
jgi:hypothetical protein